MNRGSHDHGNKQGPWAAAITPEGNVYVSERHIFSFLGFLPPFLFIIKYTRQKTIILSIHFGVHYTHNAQPSIITIQLQNSFHLVKWELQTHQAPSSSWHSTYQGWHSFNLSRQEVFPLSEVFFISAVFCSLPYTKTFTSWLISKYLIFCYFNVNCFLNLLFRLLITI